MQNFNTVKILGVKINLVSEPEVLQLVSRAVKGHAGVQLVSTNPEMILASRRDGNFKNIINNAWLSLPDGVGVIWALKRMGQKSPRLTGIDLGEKLFKIGSQKGWKFYFLGGAAGVAEAAGARIQKNFSGIIISGFHHGFFNLKEETAIVEEISRCQPDILLVGLGMAKQEKFIADNLPRLKVGIALGVGGAFDVWAGRLRRAPKIFRDLKIEWLFRLLQQPERFKRIISLCFFVWLILRNKNS